MHIRILSLTSELIIVVKTKVQFLRGTIFCVYAIVQSPTLSMYSGMNDTFSHNILA